ncbi:c-type cytochrome [Panacibacter sp. DH6]|uniref:C-type cytochrome n=1 Tax=Panacibacter microcysteis TaxID=2793269 RepID=A0A931E6K7_9BACT|nr:c-type cytochrome [Panacibacter microcysteis]MBG9376099.1 c-type cytochrome [Panacibacter microcysteis]
MKSTVIVYICCLCLLAFSCDSRPKQNPKYTPATSATDSVINSGGKVAVENYREGARMIAANDCFTCHRVEEKTIGPSYREVAARYHFNDGNVENLAHSIMYGAKGLWGEREMTPHPGLEKRDAMEMARYILSLDTTNKAN